MSYDSVEVSNGAAIGEPFKIISVVQDEVAKTITVTWNSTTNGRYALDISSDMNTELCGDIWQEEQDSIDSQGDTTSTTFATGDRERLFLRIRDTTPAP